MQTPTEIVEVLGYGSDGAGNLTRRVRLADGSEVVQTGRISVETQITRSDGTVEPGAPITNVNVRSLPS